MEEMWRKGGRLGGWVQRSDRKVDKPKAKKCDQMKSGVAGADRERMRDERETAKAKMQ